MPSLCHPVRRPEPRAAVLSLAAAVLLAACHDEPAAGPVAPDGRARPNTMEALATGPVVNSLADPGDGVCTIAECTLREAIAAANPGDEITFDAALAGGTIVLGASRLVIDKNLTVTGPGANALTLDGNHVTGVLGVNAGVTATVHGLAIARGQTSDAFGGSAVLNRGILTLRQCRIHRNVDVHGSPVVNHGSVTVRDCTVDGNQGFAAIQDVTAGSLIIENSVITRTAGHAIVSNGTIVILNSTISDHRHQNGRQIQSIAAVIRNSTIVDNAGPRSTGSAVLEVDALTISSSIVVNDGFGDCASFVINSQGRNIFRSGFGCRAGPLDQTIDIADVFAKLLAPLADNGGPTRTHALLDPVVTGFPNPAIDQGSCTAAVLTADQRGLPRPADFSAVADADDGCDVGAFELQPPPPCTVDDLVGRVDALQVDGVLNNGQANALRGKLGQVERLLDRGKVAEARTVLSDFRGQVAGLLGDGVLSAEEAADLDRCAGDVDAGLAS